MRKNFHIILTLVIVAIIQAGSWSYTYLSQKYQSNELIIQAKNDNLTIGKQLLNLLNITGYTKENPETDSLLQIVCDLADLPNAGFICISDSIGNLVAAPGLKSGMTMNFNPVLTSFMNDNSLLPVELKSEPLFQGYAYFEKENRQDILVSMPLSKNRRLFVHQNNDLIGQRSWKSVRPLILYGMVVSFLAGVFTYYTAKRTVIQYQRKIEAQVEEIKLADKKLKEGLDQLNKSIQEIENTNRIISSQKSEIIENLKYGKWIQGLSFSDSKIEYSIFDDYFCLSLPRNIAGGDFFWYMNIDGLFIIAAVDCTGHNMTGVVMSMLVMRLLNEIILTGGKRNAGLILDNLRIGFIKSLRNDTNSTSDGIELAICVFDQSDYNMQYAGANRPIIIIRNNELFELKPDKMPVGINTRDAVPYTTQQLQLIKGDLIYLFTDGYCDQFGGSNGRKFMLKNFVHLLMEIKDFPMEYQSKMLEQTILEWKGSLSQVDDILVVGLKII